MFLPSAATRPPLCRPLCRVRSAALWLSIAALATGGLSACQQQVPDRDPRLDPLPVVLATATRASAPEPEFSGVVGARQLSRLSFRVDGKIAQREVDAGVRVRRGQRLFQLDTIDLALNQRAADAELRAAEATALQTQADEQRLRELVAPGAISPQAYDQARAAADRAAATVQAARARAASAANALAYSELRADADGVVTQVLAEAGQVVRAGSPVLELAHDGERDAVVDLPETLMPALGTQALVWLSADPATAYPARLRELAGSADPQTRSFRARFALEAEAPAALGASLRLRLQLPASERELVAVPMSALRYDNGRPQLWVYNAGQVLARPVQLASLQGDQALIVGGLAAGEQVVASGVHRLHAHQQVLATESAP